MTYADPQCRLIPCLWFDHQGEEAANFYVSLLPDSRIDHVTRAPDDYPGGKAGQALEIQFTLAGQPYSALNGVMTSDSSERTSLSSYRFFAVVVTL